MTTTDTLDPVTAPSRVLRRSRTDRVGAGVAGGLGEYFAVDPVLFRVLFATSAFFGGAGVLAYLIAWAAIPEAGTEHAALDGWVRSLRTGRLRSRVVTVVALLLLWLVAFSWWAPGPFFPVMVVVLVLVGVLTRRESGRAAAPVDLTKRVAPEDTTPLGSGATATGMPGGPTWMNDTRDWLAESHQAHRERRRRAQPMRLITLGLLLVTLLVLGLVDAFDRLHLAVYFDVAAGILGVGLLVGLVLRRTPWSVTPLLVAAAIGAVGLGGSTTSLHDGFGQRQWTPTSTTAADYRLAFGQAVLDLRSLDASTTPRHLTVTVGAGQVRILAPTGLDLTVRSRIHFGQLEVDHVDTEHGSGIDHMVPPRTGASGAPVSVDVRLADGQVSIERS